MKIIVTHRFGHINIDLSKCFTFPEGILGFSHLRDFILIDHEQDEIFLYLQNVEEPWITFPVIDNAIKGNERLLSIVTIPNDPTYMTANLKAPIVLNTETMQGYQVVQKDPDLPIRHLIFKDIAAITLQGKIFKLRSMNLDICQKVI